MKRHRYVCPHTLFWQYVQLIRLGNVREGKVLANTHATRSLSVVPASCPSLPGHQATRPLGELAIRYHCNNTIMASLSKSKKNSKSVNTATDTSSNKSLKGNGQASICPICCDVIVDATAGDDGQDSIFCDGAYV